MHGLSPAIKAASGAARLRNRGPIDRTLPESILRITSTSAVMAMHYVTHVEGRGLPPARPTKYNIIGGA